MYKLSTENLLRLGAENPVPPVPGLGVSPEGSVGVIWVIPKIHRGVYVLYIFSTFLLNFACSRISKSGINFKLSITLFKIFSKNIINEEERYVIVHTHFLYNELMHAKA